MLRTILVAAILAAGLPEFPGAEGLRLDQRLRDAGVPLVGVTGDASHPYRAILKDEATPEQRAVAASILSTWTPELSPSDLRGLDYKEKVDLWTNGVVRYQVLLELIPDTPPNATRRAKIQAKLAAAKQRILDLTNQIEAAHPDAP